jgi:thioredoxin 1
MSEQLTLDTFKTFVNQHHVVVVDFYAEWCPPCQRFLKILPRLEELLTGVAVVGKVDVDKEEHLSDLQAIHSVPTFIIFKNGLEVTRWTGIKTINEIEEMIRTI